MRHKLHSALLAVVAAASACLLPAWAADKASEQIVVLCTNDVHCETDQWKDDDGTVENLGYPGVAAYKQEMEKQYGAENVTLVDAGDAIQGSAIGTLSDGAYLVDLMNQVGYDYAVPGNHEFDYGMDKFLALASGENKKAEYTYLSSNFRDKDGNLIFPAYEIVDYGAVQVAYVGICTPETMSKSAPTHFQDDKGQYIYSFGGDAGKLYEDVQDAVDEAVEKGADYVVAVAHLGQTGITKAWRSDEVIANTTGIDVMLDGHSHESYEQEVKNKDGEEVLLLQTGHNLTALAKVTIDPAAGEIDGELVQGYDGSEPETARLLASIHDELDVKLDEQVGTLDVDLVAEDAQENQLVRFQETNLGDFCADAYRTSLNADVAVVNGGGIRANVDKGVVTYGDIIDVHPYNNQLSVAEVTGQQLLDALEMGARMYPEPCGGFLQVSGVTCEIDASVPSHVVVDDNAAFVKVDGEYRVKNVRVGDAPLDLAKTYRLASHDYMLKQGGDGMTMFQGCSIPESEVMLDNQALINYMADGVYGTAYTNPDGEGRIRVVDGAEPAEPPAPEVKDFTDVPPEHWAYDEIMYVTGLGLFQGDGDAFYPDVLMTRGMMAVVLHNQSGAPSGASVASFPDVVDSWQAEAVHWAVQEGVVTGYPNGTFGPNDSVTREQMAVILYRFADSPAVADSDLNFGDASLVSGYAENAVRWAVEKGILTGKPGQMLDPQGSTTRAEAAAILDRYLKGGKK